MIVTMSRTGSDAMIHLTDSVVIDASARGAFLLEPLRGATRFTAELDFGVASPVLAPLVDAILQKVFGRQLAAFRVHLREEGANLKRLMEGMPGGKVAPS